MIVTITEDLMEKVMIILLVKGQLNKKNRKKFKKWLSGIIE
jgi:hypothetical protein